MKRSTMTSMLKSFCLTVLAVYLFLSAGCDTIFKAGPPPCKCQCTCREDSNTNQLTEKCADSIVNPSDPNGCGDACMAEDTSGVNECSPPGIPPLPPPPPPCAKAMFYFCLVCGDEPQACGTDITQSACTADQAMSLVDTTTAGDVDSNNDPCDVVVGPCGTVDESMCLNIG